MRIECPHCGQRGSEEFAYLGDATVSRPDGEGVEALPAWMDYVYLRANPAGSHREFWYHGAGCRAWLVVTRDVRTHDILAVEAARDAALATKAGAA
jgi:heterotetrameric sarcosine oxidase delta subunit